jgi:hypothetical protein
MQKYPFVDLIHWQHLTVLAEKYQAQVSPIESFCLLEKCSQLFCDHIFFQILQIFDTYSSKKIFTLSILQCGQIIHT